MFDKFSDEARQAVVLAQEECRRLSHGYIGTEHLLLGLIKDTGTVATEALVSMGADLEAIRERVVVIIGTGDGEVPSHIPFTPRAKRVLDTGLREAVELGHHYIGSEHILLGLLREGDGIAAQVLNGFGIDLEPARARIVEMVGRGEIPPPGLAHPTRVRNDPALASLLFVAVALVAVVIEPPTTEIRLWGLSLLLGGTLLWAGGAVIGTGEGAGLRMQGMGRVLRALGGLTMATAASVFVLGALLA